MKKKLFFFILLMLFISLGTGKILYPGVYPIISKPADSFVQDKKLSQEEYYEYRSRADRIGELGPYSPKRFNHVYTIKPGKFQILENTDNFSVITSPQFSPDGKKLVFSAGEKNRQDIWIIDKEGNKKKQLTNDAFDNITPSWIMSGGKILYSSNKTGNYEIWIMNSDGTDKKQLTNDSKYDKKNPKCSPIIWKNYYWDKKAGRTVLYQAEDDTSSSIWMISEDGALPSNITGGFGTAGKSVNPEWSPHGLTIIYDHEQAGENRICEGWCKMYWTRQGVRGSSRKFLPVPPGGLYPQYLPNQTKLTFIRDGKLYYASVDGSDVESLKLHGTINGNYDWSPDGLSIAYVTSTEGKDCLCVQDVSYPLQEVTNVWLYNDLSGSQVQALVQNRFVVTGRGHNLFHQLYERYARYTYPSPYPLFITTDSILEVYHLFFDYTLRTLEEKELLPLLEQFVFLLSDKLNALLSEDVTVPGFKRDAEKLYAYIKTAELLLDPAIQMEDSPLIKRAREEAALIKEHDSRTISPVFEQNIDYTVYTIRGHYTKNDMLGKYFQVMSLLGIPKFRTISDEGHITEAVRKEIRQALILSRLIQSDLQLFELWKKLYNPIMLFVGAADDLTVPDFIRNMKEIYTNDSIAEFYDKKKLEKFLGLIEREKFPRIGSPSEGKSFRIMPQRFTPDGYIHQELLYPKVGTDTEPRLLPKGLDIMGVLGSDRAYHILDRILSETKYENYNRQYNTLKDKFSLVTTSEWKQNMYWGWLYMLKSLLPVYGEKYPEFMRNAAWRDKCLFTALASWTELRHDTILYAKISGAEAGEGGEGWEPVRPNPRGYVEPNPEFFSRMEELINTSYQNLSENKFLDEELNAKLMKFKGIVENLKTIAEKELTGGTITEQEYNFIKWYGSEIEYLTIFLFEGTANFISEGSTALIADIAVDKMNSFYLHEAVGNVREINVIVEIDGRKQMNIGGILTYYEFAVKDKRLNDDDWKEMLRNRTAPALPGWTKSFIVEGN